MTRADRGLDPFVPGRPVDPPAARGVEVVGDRYVAPLAGEGPPAPRDRRMRCSACGADVDVPRAGVAYWSRLPVVCAGCGR